MGKKEGALCRRDQANSRGCGGKNKKITSGWCKTSSLVRRLAKRQWLCEGCHRPSCPPPLAPRRWLNKPGPTKPTAVPELRRASVPQDPVLRKTNLPRISLKCWERQQRITNVRDTGEAAAGAEEEERRRAATSSERLRAAGETKEKGSRNTCEQTLQLGTARLKTSFPGEGGEQKRRQVISPPGNQPLPPTWADLPALPRQPGVPSGGANPPSAPAARG